MSQQSRTIERLQTMPQLPGSLDPTRTVQTEAEYSEEAMDAKAHRVRSAIAEAKMNGTQLPPEFHKDAYEVGIWFADPSSTPRELARIMYGEPKPTQDEQLRSFFRTDLGAKFMTIRPEDRQKMITQVGVDFD